MVTLDVIRKLIADLPGVEEGYFHTAPAPFKVEAPKNLVVELDSKS